jgi:hypothetical protein
VVAVAAWLSLAGIRAAERPDENWPQWRGPNGLGLSAATDYVEQWAPDKNIAWKSDTTSPYHWLRHPIYAAILYFVWSTAIDHRSAEAFAAAAPVTVGACVRMYAEETLSIGRYPEYAAYCARTARVIPFVL